MTYCSPSYRHDFEDTFSIDSAEPVMYSEQQEERDQLLADEPNAAPWIRPLLGSEEFLNGTPRFCLWLIEISPAALSTLPKVFARVESVRLNRAASKRATTRKLAATPTLFGEIRQPANDFLVIPEVSSERRYYIPIGFLPQTTIVTNKLYTVASARQFEFGVLQSAMHMAWTRCVCGRLESRYQYSTGIVYNNFPWPQQLDDKHRSAIESAAQGVLDARAAHAGSTLAQLYDPNTMPPDLAKAHDVLDRAVDAAYVADGGPKKYAGDAERVAFLFRRYAALTSIV